MRHTRVVGSENETTTAAILAAADDARLHHRFLARAAVIAGIVLVVGSTLLWPRGLFGLGADSAAVSLVLITSGALLLFFGVLTIAWSVRKLSRLLNNYNSAGKPLAGFSVQPDIGFPQIGQGHGGPMDASAALFANPDKVNIGRR